VQSTKNIQIQTQIFTANALNTQIPQIESQIFMQINPNLNQSIAEITTTS